MNKERRPLTQKKGFYEPRLKQPKKRVQNMGESYKGLKGNLRKSVEPFKEDEND